MVKLSEEEKQCLDIDIENFWSYSQIKPKHKKAFRHSGGITILVKGFLRPGLKLVKDEEGFIWFRLLKSFFNIDNDIFVCATYIPPKNTTTRIKNKTDYWENLTNSIINYNSKGNILITGDLNARTGTNTDTKYLNQLCPIEQNIGIPIDRNNCDNKINRYGKKLMEICDIFPLNIANGRVAGNRLGNFTCFNSGGASVVDYFIGDSTIISNMHEMIVEPPIFNSKHAPITTKLKVNLPQKIKENLDKIAKSFKWDKSSGEVFRKILSASESLKTINDIKYKLMIGNEHTHDIDIAVNKLTDFLNVSASKSLKLKKYTNKSNKNKRSNKWYDKECINLKKRLDNLAILFGKNPKDPYISGQYYACRKKYKTIIKQKRRNAEIKDINQLMKLVDNSSQFWKKDKKLRNGNKKSVNLISPTDWYNYFSKLANTDERVNKECYNKQHYIILEKLKDILQNTEQMIATEELDKPLTQKEIEEGIDKLKNNKASGNDSISNEMLKSAKKIISPLITDIFNKIKTIVYFPELWKIGTIIPLHKMDDMCNPDNYRGITINSCLSKLFTQIMNDRLTNYIEKNNLIKQNQIGFKKGNRTLVFTYLY